MLFFFLLNLDNEYHNVRSITVEQKKSEVNINLTGKLESSDIRKLAGAAFQTADVLDKQSKKIESKVIDVIEGELIDVPPEDIKQISSDINNKFLESIVDE